MVKPAPAAWTVCITQDKPSCLDLSLSGTKPKEFGPDWAPSSFRYGPPDKSTDSATGTLLLKRLLAQCLNALPNVREGAAPFVGDLTKCKNPSQRQITTLGISGGGSGNPTQLPLRLSPVGSPCELRWMSYFVMLSWKKSTRCCHHLGAVKAFSQHNESSGMRNWLTLAFITVHSGWSNENDPTTDAVSPGEAPDTEHKTVAAEQRLLHDPTKALEEVSVWVCPGNETRAGQARPLKVLEAATCRDKYPFNGQTHQSMKRKRTASGEYMALTLLPHVYIVLFGWLCLC